VYHIISYYHPSWTRNPTHPTLLCPALLCTASPGAGLAVQYQPYLKQRVDVCPPKARQRTWTGKEARRTVATFMKTAPLCDGRALSRTQILFSDGILSLLHRISPF
jgi:hypothetical protein